MSELLTGLSTQPDFPRVDLLDANADLLELLMANAQVLHGAHAAAEQDSWAFRIGHRAIVNGVGRRNTSTDPGVLAAANIGIAAFEAATSIVQGISQTSDLIPANREFMRLARFSDRHLDEYIEDSLISFELEMPRTAEVIQNSTRRFHASFTHFAVLGAAMSRRFDLDSVA